MILKQLGKGKDVTKMFGEYNELRLASVWEIKHPTAKKQYEANRDEVVRDMKQLDQKGKHALTASPPGLPAATAQAAATFDFNPAASEAYLLHSTDPSNLLSVLKNGLNERFSGTSAGTAFGDGVYLALVSSVELRDVTTDGAYRNGLSIISASGLVVAGCRFLNTAGTPPQAGIDIEPNHVKPGRRPERLERVVLRDIEARRNLGAGLSFSISKLTGADALDIVVDGAVIEGAAETQAGADALLYNIGVYVGGKSSPNASSSDSELPSRA